MVSHTAETADFGEAWNERSLYAISGLSVRRSRLVHDGVNLLEIGSGLLHHYRFLDAQILLEALLRAIEGVLKWTSTTTLKFAR